MRENSNIRVAACQLLNTPDVPRSTKRVIEMLHQCADQQIDIAAFPEGTLFGYCNRPDYWESISLEVFAQAEEAISKACAERRIAAVVGAAYRSGDQWINGLAIFDKDGTLKARYGKVYLAGEKWCINHRGRLPLVTLAGVDCCFIICHDVRYPELVRLPAALGAKVCFFCSCESGLTAEHKLSAYRAMPISRATENGIYLVMANTPADPQNLSAAGNSHGNSKIVNPDGNVLVEAGFFEERIVTAELDLSAAQGHPAKRGVSEETILRGWWKTGIQYVERIE